MASTATPRLARPERRDLVLRAGGAEFGRRGYAAARIEDIARAAGVTKPIVYRHFESKKGLYLALLRKHETDLPTFLRGRPADGTVPILELWLDYVRANSHAWLMLFRDHSGDEEIRRGAGGGQRDGAEGAGRVRGPAPAGPAIRPRSSRSPRC